MCYFHLSQPWISSGFCYVDSGKVAWNSKVQSPCCRFRMLKVVAGHKYLYDIAIVDLHGNNERAKVAESTEVTT